MVAKFHLYAVTSSIPQLANYEFKARSTRSVAFFVRGELENFFVGKSVLVAVPFPTFSNFYSTSIWFNSSSSLFAVSLPPFLPSAPPLPLIFNIRNPFTSTLAPLLLFLLPPTTLSFPSFKFLSECLVPPFFLPLRLG